MEKENPPGQKQIPSSRKAPIVSSEASAVESASDGTTAEAGFWHYNGTAPVEAGFWLGEEVSCSEIKDMRIQTIGGHPPINWSHVGIAAGILLVPLIMLAGLLEALWISGLWPF